MEIRKAEPRDYDSITRIWNRVIDETLITFTAERKTVDSVASLVANRAKRGFSTFVAIEGEEVAGYVTYDQFRTGPGYAYTVEHSIALDPAFDRRGIGRALMEAMEIEARTLGLHSVIAGVSGANPLGVTFHAALGYEEIARLPEVGFKWDQWLDLIVMQKRL